MPASKPTVVKVVQTELEEREPPDESEYEFLETFTAKMKKPQCETAKD